VNAGRLADYRTARGRRFGFMGWAPGESPLEQFDAGNWVACLHACLLCFSALEDAEKTQEAIEDDGLLHELVHLASGVDICTHAGMADLREQVSELQEDFVEWNEEPEHVSN